MLRQIKSLAGGKKSKTKASAEPASCDPEEDTYKDVKEKDLPKFLLACWQGDLGQVAKSLKKKPSSGETLYRGRSGLHLAAHMERDEVVDYLVQACPSLLNAKDTSGCTPLIRAVRSSSGRCATRLLAAGCDVAAVDDSETTALHRCAQVNDERMAKELIDNRAPLDALDRSGNTPLHHAVLSGSIETSDLLLSSGCSADILNDDTLTPLMIAASENRVMMAKNSLLKYPCNLLLVNADGYKASDLAVVSGNHGLSDLIVQHESRQASAARGSIGNASQGRQPSLLSSPPALSSSSQAPRSAAGQAPSYQSVVSGEATARNPSVDDIDISEAHDESQVSHGLNSWGSGESDLEETSTKEAARPQKPAAATSRPPSTSAAGGRLSPWTTISPPAAQGTESESSDGGSHAGAVSYRASRTRVPSTAMASTAMASTGPQSPPATGQAPSVNVAESRIPRPQGGNLPPLSRKTSSTSLRSGSRIPVLSQPTSPKEADSSQKDPVTRPAAVGTAGVTPLAGRRAAQQAAGMGFKADRGAKELMDDDGVNDEDWDTESTVSGAGDFMPTQRTPPASVLQPLKSSSVAREETDQGPAMQPAAPADDSVSSDFSLDEGGQPMATNRSEDNPNSAQSVLKQVASDDFGLDDASFAASEDDSQLHSSFPPGDDSLSPIQAPRQSMIGIKPTAAVPAEDSEDDDDLPPDLPGNIHPGAKGQDSSIHDSSSDFSFHSSAEVSPTKVDGGLTSTFTSQKPDGELQPQEKGLATGDDGSEWDSEGSQVTGDEQEDDEEQERSAGGPPPGRQSNAPLTQQRAASQGMFGDLSASPSASEDEGLDDAALEQTGLAESDDSDGSQVLAAGRSLLSRPSPSTDDVGLQRKSTQSAEHQPDNDPTEASSDFSLSDENLNAGPHSGDGTFAMDTSGSSRAGTAAGSSLFGDVNLPTEKLGFSQPSRVHLEPVSTGSPLGDLPSVGPRQTLPSLTAASPRSSSQAKPSSTWEQAMQAMQESDGGESDVSNGPTTLQPAAKQLAQLSNGSEDDFDLSDHDEEKTDDEESVDGSVLSDKEPEAEPQQTCTEERPLFQATTLPSLAPHTAQPDSTGWKSFEEENQKARDLAQQRRLEQERLAQEAEERARQREEELQTLAREEEERRTAMELQRLEEDKRAEEMRQQQERLEEETRAAKVAAENEKKQQEAIRIKQEREVRLAEEDQERQRLQQEVAARHQLKLQESIEEQRSLARRHSLTMSPRSDGRADSNRSTPRSLPQLLTGTATNTAPGKGKLSSQANTQKSTESLLASSRPTSSLAHRVPKAGVSPTASAASSVVSSEREVHPVTKGNGDDDDDETAALSDGGASQLLEALASDSDLSVPGMTSTPKQRSIAARSRETPSSRGLGDATFTKHHKETIRDLRNQLEEVKREMAAGARRCELLQIDLAEAKQSGEEVNRQKATAEHAHMDSELKQRNLAFLHQQECEARQTADALVMHLRERTESLEKRMAEDTAGRHAAESMCRQLEMERNLYQSQLQDFQQKLSSSVEEVNQERNSKQLLKELLDQQKVYQTTLQEEATKVSQSKNEIATTTDTLSRECRELKDKLAVQQSQLELAQAELEVAQRHNDELTITHEVDVEELRGVLQERSEALNLAQQVLSQDKLSHQLERQNLETQLQQITAQLESSRAQAKSQQDEIRMTEVQLAERTSQLTSLTHDKDLREQSAKSLEEQLRQKMEAHDRIMAELATAREKLSSLDAEVTFLRSQSQTANEKLSEREKAAAEAQQRFSEVLNSCRQDAERAKHDAESRQQQTYQQLVSAKEQLSRSESTGQSLQHELSALNKEYRLMSEKGSETTAALQDKLKLLADFEDRCARQDEQVTSLAEKLATIQRDLVENCERERHLQEQLEASERLNVEVGERLQLTTTDAIGVASTKNDLDQELSRLSQQHAQLTLAMKELQKKYDDVTGVSLASKETYVRLEARTSQLKSENLRLSQKLKEETSLRSVAEHDSEEAKSLWEGEIRSRSHLGAQIVDFEKKEGSFKVSLDQEKRKTLKALHMKRDADNKVAAAEQRCTELEQLVNRYHADFKASKRRVKDLQSSQVALPKLQADMDLERRRYQEQVTALQDKLARSTKECQVEEAQLHEVKKTRSKLKDELKHSRSEVLSAAQREHGLQSAVRDLEASKATAEHELGELKGQLGTKWINVAEVESLRRKVQLEYRAELNKRLGEVNSHLQEQAHTRTALDELHSSKTTKDLSEQTSRVAALKANLEETIAKLQDAQLHHDVAQAEIQKYKKLYEAEARHSQSLSTRLMKSNRIDKQTSRLRLSQVQASLRDNPGTSGADRNSLFLSATLGGDAASKLRLGSSYAGDAGMMAASGKQWP